LQIGYFKIFILYLVLVFSCQKQEKSSKEDVLTARQIPSMQAFVSVASSDSDKYHSFYDIYNIPKEPVGMSSNTDSEEDDSVDEYLDFTKYFHIKHCLNSGKCKDIYTNKFLETIPYSPLTKSIRVRICERKDKVCSSFKNIDIKQEETFRIDQPTYFSDEIEVLNKYHETVSSMYKSWGRYHRALASCTQEDMGKDYYDIVSMRSKQDTTADSQNPNDITAPATIDPASLSFDDYMHLVTESYPEIEDLYYDRDDEKKLFDYTYYLPKKEQSIKLGLLEVDEPEEGKSCGGELTWQDFKKFLACDEVGYFGIITTIFSLVASVEMIREANKIDKEKNDKKTGLIEKLGALEVKLRVDAVDAEETLEKAQRLKEALEVDTDPDIIRYTDKAMIIEQEAFPNGNNRIIKYDSVTQGKFNEGKGKLVGRFEAMERGKENSFGIGSQEIQRIKEEIEKTKTITELNQIAKNKLNITGEFVTTKIDVSSSRSKKILSVLKWLDPTFLPIIISGKINSHAESRMDRGANLQNISKSSSRSIVTRPRTSASGDLGEGVAQYKKQLKHKKRKKIALGVFSLVSVVSLAISICELTSELCKFADSEISLTLFFFAPLSVSMFVLASGYWAKPKSSETADGSGTNQRSSGGSSRGISIKLDDVYPSSLLKSESFMYKNPMRVGNTPVGFVVPPLSSKVLLTQNICQRQDVGDLILNTQWLAAYNKRQSLLRLFASYSSPDYVKEVCEQKTQLKDKSVKDFKICQAVLDMEK
jgi:hypothetical protein